MDIVSLFQRLLDRQTASAGGGLLARLRHAVRRPRHAPASVAADIQRVDMTVKRTQGELAEVGAQAQLALEVAHDVALPAKLLAFMSWLELHPPEAGGPLISVVLATRDRPETLERAIASVVAQRYRDWELIVVDDGTVSETRAVVARTGDRRVRLVEGPRSGLSAARNAGLASVTGEIVCYCDDDNVMHPGWLHAVAQVFAERDDVEIAYGVTIAEHRLPGERAPQGWWPSFWQLPWSRQTLLKENVTDAGSLAHRSGLDEARYDERVTTAEDWDLLLRLTVEREALAIPAVSHAYTMRAPDRMSEAADHRAGLEKVRRRHAGG